MKFLPFVEARGIVKKLQLKNKQEWSEYCKSSRRRIDIPANPPRTYAKEWKGWGDFLGTGRVANQKRIYLPYEEARKSAQSLHIKSSMQWRQYYTAGRIPKDIPSHPDRIYRKHWKGWAHWLGANNASIQNKDFKREVLANENKKWMKFEEARVFVNKLGLKTRFDWKLYCKSGKKPDNIPEFPSFIYSDEWKGWSDWLGITQSKIKIKPFREARRYARALKLNSKKEWVDFCNSGKKSPDVPVSPESVYKSHWKGWGDWLGTGTIANMKRTFVTFQEGRKFAQSLKLSSSSEWEEYRLKNRLPKNIPTHPERTYAKEWKGWGDWLGTVTLREIKFRPFEDARKLVRSLNFQNRDQFTRYCKTKERPKDIPTQPARTYKKYWKGWGDWLGTETIATWKREYLPFKQAREFAHSLNLQRVEDWDGYLKSGRKPDNIPAAPWNTYKNEWLGIFDWLGYEGKQWSVTKIKELLRHLINSRAIYSWTEARLYSFFLRKGLLSLHNNRHAKFFKGLIQLSRSQNGIKAILDYANSNDKNPPEVKESNMNSYEDEILTASSDELSRITESSDPLDYGRNTTVEHILKQTHILESINVDEEAIRFYLDSSVNDLWKLAFQDESGTVKSVKWDGKNGNKYHDYVVETFLDDYESSRNIVIPDSYNFPRPPTLMQLYVTHKIKNLQYFGNFSGTGAGKTLSAILASRVIQSWLTVIVCPNDVVEQWKRNILDTFPNSKVITGKDAFYVQNSEIQYQYAVLNYDKFSQEESPNLILNLAKQRVDFVILDEIHFTKIRNEEEISQRRRNLDGLMTAVRRINPKVKVLGLSATPVVNNLREGRSLLELITGKVYDDIAVRPTIPNAVTLHEKLSTISIRELPRYSIDVDTQTIDVAAEKPPEISIRHLKSNPLAIEKFLTDSRIPEIIKLIDGQTIIYTEYVEDIVQKLSTAVNEAGYNYALYTGFDRSGLSRFLSNQVQVLIASHPLSVGVDGLQFICNRLIINTLPWTNAQYQQLLGRLVRKGQERDAVHVYLIKASIGGYQYDELKWKRIQFKRTLADCAIDGTLPEKSLVTPEQAAMELVKWLERLERGEISTVVRRDVNVELTPVELKKRVIKYGDFTKLNNKINTENSETTHLRMLKDPKEWEEYHRQYIEARKSWPIIPFDEIIKRIQQLSPRLLIGDFGCGEAKIFEKFGDRVSSFDHVAINNKVKACDMKSVPLSDEAIDIAVFSLSLMGRNWPDYIKEAKRCLATNGYLLIAETTKSMKGRLSKLKEEIEKQGFDIYNEEEKGDFTFIEAREL